MLERIIVLVGVVAIVVLAVLAARRWNRRRVSGVLRQVPDWQVLGAEPDGRRTVIAFSTPSCAACHVAQSPAIELARAALADVGVRRIDVDTAQQPEAARAFGILTVPSTVVIAAVGTRVVAVNQGFTASTRLVEQLQTN
ncbi:MAG: thioredoxin family protein [Chloroflexi bacterium]|nr:thioredoxin family protein [Chloroflexota bacterium]